MSEWRGLHNPDRHHAIPREDMSTCRRCFAQRGHALECRAGDPCRCCLQAEVQHLSTALREIKRLTEEGDRDGVLVTVYEALAEDA